METEDAGQKINKHEVIDQIIFNECNTIYVCYGSLLPLVQYTALGKVFPPLFPLNSGHVGFERKIAANRRIWQKKSPEHSIIIPLSQLLNLSHVQLSGWEYVQIEQF